MNSVMSSVCFAMVSVRIGSISYLHVTPVIKKNTFESPGETNAARSQPCGCHFRILLRWTVSLRTCGARRPERHRHYSLSTAHAHEGNCCDHPVTPVLRCRARNWFKRAERAKLTERTALESPEQANGSSSRMSRAPRKSTQDSNIFLLLAAYIEDAVNKSECY